MGGPLPTDRERRKGLANTAFLIFQGKVLASQDKSLLPAYDVFDETRHFDPAARGRGHAFLGKSLGISVCEDAWCGPELLVPPALSTGPHKVLAQKGATVLINMSASPFQVGKQSLRFHLMQHHAKKAGCRLFTSTRWAATTNSFLTAAAWPWTRRGEPLAVLPGFAGAGGHGGDRPRPGTPGLFAPPEPIATVRDALVLGLRDYLHKMRFYPGGGGALRRGGFSRGLRPGGPGPGSGKRPGRGRCPRPSPPRDSLADAAATGGQNLGVDYRVIPITPMYEAYSRSLREHMPVDRVEVDPGKRPGPHPGQHPHGPVQHASGTWCWPPATRASWPWATARFTAT